MWVGLYLIGLTVMAWGSLMTCQKKIKEILTRIVTELSKKDWITSTSKNPKRDVKKWDEIQKLINKL